MRYSIFAAFAAVCLVFAGGCNLAGFLASPTPHEKKVPAEYNLRNTQSRVMVFVDEARIGSVPFDLRSRIDERLRAGLMKKVRVAEKNILDATDYSPSRLAANSGLSPAQIGLQAGADLVVYVWIENYELQQMHSAGYFSGSILTRSVLLDVASGKVLWPKGEEVKLARIRFELETKGRTAAIERLAAGVAHCVTRYFYDCPGDEFRWGDEQKELDRAFWQ